MEQPVHPQAEAVLVSDTYEPPRIEKVLTADDLAREIQYAGGNSADNLVNT